MHLQIANETCMPYYYDNNCFISYMKNGSVHLNAVGKKEKGTHTCYSMLHGAQIMQNDSILHIGETCVTFKQFSHCVCRDINLSGYMYMAA